jgi:carbohydrate kinase (thermoresistant glucokinase family)
MVVMGVTGSGKSTLGGALAQALGWRFLEGDTLHPASNIAKMAAGVALNDEDRLPFLNNVARAIVESRPEGIVISCSALKRSYRALLRGSEPDLIFVLPMLTRERLMARLEQRSEHFMPGSLLDSQLATLELPQPDELWIPTQGELTTDEQVRETLRALTALDVRSR